MLFILCFNMCFQKYTLFLSKIIKAVNVVVKIVKII